MPFDSEVSTKSRDLIVLEKARERIAQGWCQSLIDEKGNLCIVGALKAETGDIYTWAPGQVDSVAHYLRLLGFLVPCNNDTASATLWNDAKGRSQAQVLARFDAAIARLGAEPVR